MPTRQSGISVSVWMAAGRDRGGHMWVSGPTGSSSGLIFSSTDLEFGDPKLIGFSSGFGFYPRIPNGGLK